MTHLALSRLGATILAVALPFAGSSLGSADTRGSFDRSLEIPGQEEVVELDVATGSGDITVRTGGDGVVAVHGEIRARSGASDKVRRIEANPPIEQDGNVIRIGRIEDEELRRGVSISYELIVPAATKLTTKTGSGSVSVGDIHGPLVAASGSGSLELGRIGADVEAVTGSGDITIDGVAGNLEAKSGSGSLRANGVAGTISAKSGSGTVELHQTGPGDVSVRTGSGDIQVDGVRGALALHTGSGDVQVEGAPTADWNLNASSGDITIELPEDATFELDAKTSSGDLDSTHPITVVGKINKKKLHGMVRGGGPLLSLRTSSGDIRIK